MNARIFRGEAQLDAVPADDRGLAYGDGLFETLRVHRGSVPWWRDHWSRLRLGGERLGIPLPEDVHVHGEAATLFADGGDGVLKLLLTRGAGERGYALPENPIPTWIVSRHAAPATPDRGLRLHLCATRAASQPALAGIKHCNRLEQVLARAEVERAGCDEGLLSDTDGRPVCATAANLLVFDGQGWRTPAVDRCGVAGVLRGWLLEQGLLEEAALSMEDVASAEALALCNAVRGILPVAMLGARRWRAHPATTELQARLAMAYPMFSVPGQARP